MIEGDEKVDEKRQLKKKMKYKMITLKHFFAT